MVFLFLTGNIYSQDKCKCGEYGTKLSCDYEKAVDEWDNLKLIEDEHGNLYIQEIIKNIMVSDVDREVKSFYDEIFKGLSSIYKNLKVEFTDQSKIRSVLEISYLSKTLGYLDECDSYSGSFALNSFTVTIDKKQKRVRITTTNIVKGDHNLEIQKTLGAQSLKSKNPKFQEKVRTVQYWLTANSHKSYMDNLRKKLTTKSVLTEDW